ncbi:MAG: hypothetical protein IRZ26_06950 [Clostridia bacterium]|nr:hypothetical protein [Clostridia bacterium]MCL6521955.1 hypothetical protein [Bacillota bacterium]
MEILALLSVSSLAAVLAMTVSRQLDSLIGLYRWQSLLLTGTVLALAVRLGHAHLFWTAGMALLLKVWAIPSMLRRLIHGTILERSELHFPLTATGTLLFASLLTVFGLAVGIGLGPSGTASLESAVGLASFLLGLALVALRSEAIAQVIGLLVAENGSMLLILALAPSLRLVLDAGLFFETVIGAWIMALLVHRMHLVHGHTNTSLLRELGSRWV